ncbi:hypothetical protein QUF76_09050 [Desulfobacterales bacterium HSG16]|nr:hypothetical protein [Desulfobacterales bacterium HSG16]
MKIFKNIRGSSILAVLMAVFFLSTLLFLSLMRSEAALRLVKYRYLESIALDLAENGIEFEKMIIKKNIIKTMIIKKVSQPIRDAARDKIEYEGRNDAINKTHYKKFNTFAGYAGSFESFFKPLKSGAYEITSRGKLTDSEKKPAFTAEIMVQIALDRRGSWKTIGWSEQCVKHIER